MVPSLIHCPTNVTNMSMSRFSLHKAKLIWCMIEVNRLNQAIACEALIERYRSTCCCTSDRMDPGVVERKLCYWLEVVCNVISGLVNHLCVDLLSNASAAYTHMAAHAP
jgi:hypothetical protein